MAIRAVSARPIRPDVHQRFLQVLARAEARAREEADRIRQLDVKPLRIKRAQPVHHSSTVWTPERRQTVARMWNAGASRKEIQAEIGRPVYANSITHLRRRYGLKLKLRVRRRGG
jgi:hypothetical protein